MKWNGKEVLNNSTFNPGTAVAGCLVDMDVIDKYMDCLPPELVCSACAQPEEQSGTRIDLDTHEERPVYLTFRQVAGEWPDSIWEYCGRCFFGETEQRGLG